MIGFLSGIVSILMGFAAYNVHASDRIMPIEKFVIDATNGQRFSHPSVALDNNNNLFISTYSATLHSTKKLLVYTYQHSPEHDDRWRETAVLAIPQYSKAHKRDYTLIVNDDFIIVVVSGEFAHSETIAETAAEAIAAKTTGRGAIYILDRRKPDIDSWDKVEMTGENQAKEAYILNSSAAIDNNTFVVSAKFTNNTNMVQGSVLIYDRAPNATSEWTLVKKIVGGEIGASVDFGSSVAVKADTIAIGDKGRDGAGGTVYIYKHSAGKASDWVLQKNVTIKNMLVTGLGASVSLSDEYLLAGTLSNNAYLFARDQGGTDHWGPLKLLTPEYHNPLTSGFGLKVFLSDEHALVSSGYGESSNEGQASGAVYLFERDNGGKNNWGLGAVLENQDETSEFAKGKVSATNNDYIATLSIIDQHNVENQKGINGGLHVFLYRILQPTDLMVQQSHVGAFNRGQAGTYKITIKNVGEITSTGKIAVTKSLPNGVTYRFAHGLHWKCGVQKNNVGCVTEARIDAKETKALYLKVDIDEDAPRQLINSVSVSGGGDSNRGNNTMIDTTIIGSNL